MRLTEEMIRLLALQQVNSMNERAMIPHTFTDGFARRIERAVLEKVAKWLDEDADAFDKAAWGADSHFAFALRDAAKEVRTAAQEGEDA